MVEQIQNFALSIGLDTPLKRAAVFTVVGAGALVLTKPAVFFDANGVQRPIAILKQQEAGGVEPAVVPWWLAAVVGGFVLANVI